MQLENNLVYLYCSDYTVYIYVYTAIIIAKCVYTVYVCLKYTLFYSVYIRIGVIVLNSQIVILISKISPVAAFQGPRRTRVPVLGF